MKKVIIVGAGLAGSEAAWQAARQGAEVTLYEMRPEKSTPAHKTAGFAELVCSNSLRSDELTNAVGLLKAEMRAMGSIIMESADANKVAAGGALGADRNGTPYTYVIGYMYSGSSQTVNTREIFTSPNNYDIWLCPVCGRDPLGNSQGTALSPNLYMPCYGYDIAAAGGEKRCNQGGRRADDHVERAIGAQDVREHAADEQSPACLGHQERQNRHRLGKAELDGAVGKVQGVGEHRQRDVDSRDERAAGELFGVKVHGWDSFLL